jgi:hypothetical protein
LLNIDFDSKVAARVLDYYEADLLRLVSTDLMAKILMGSFAEQLALFKLLLKKVPEISDILPDNLPNDDDFKYQMFTMCIQAGCRNLRQIESFALLRFKEFGMDLCAGALRSGIVGLLPKLINYAIHLFVGGNTEVVPLLDVFVDEHGTKDKVGERLVTLLVERLVLETEVNSIVRLLRKFRQVNEEVLRSVWDGLENWKKAKVVQILAM